jgi:exodeoxyribonuclease-3
MRIATYNAASVRARLPRILEWMDEHVPDVVAIQETKVENDKFPREEFEGMGYEIALNGQKSWNGVAILSKLPLTDVRFGFEDDLMPNDARLITARVNGVSLINTYVPNGNTVGSDKWEYKMRWLERFARFVRERYAPEELAAWVGDVNIAPEPLDVYDSAKVYGGVGHHPDEFSRLAEILRFGWVDCFRKLHPTTPGFTYWDFTVIRGFSRDIGWRIDHIYATPPLAERVLTCWVDREARAKERPSDHTFVVADLDL